MESRKIYVICGEGFTKEKITKDIKEEGYPHKFYFGTGENIVDMLKYTDEVWLWGDCSGVTDYIVAKDLGKDLWRMG